MAKSILGALGMAFAMGWEILWPLILGFALSAVVQAVVSHRQMARLLPDDRPRSIATALALGAASSSCSYAAVALARALFRKGANFTAAMAFEMASTNLVAELSIIMLAFLGWQLTLAEFVGAPIMVALLVLLFRWVSHSRASGRGQDAGGGGHRRSHGRPCRNGHVRDRGRHPVAAHNVRKGPHCDQPLFRDGLGGRLARYCRRPTHCRRARRLGARRFWRSFFLSSTRWLPSCGGRSLGRWWR